MNFYQIMRIMKISMVLLTCFLIQVSASSYAQRITLEKQESYIVDILKQIRKQTNYNFLYDANSFSDLPKVNIQKQTGTIDQILSKTFTNLPIEHLINNKTIIINRTSVKDPLKQEQFEIKGQVFDPNNKALQGVTINIKGSKTNAISDINGNFSIKLSGSNAILVFTNLGFERKEVSVNSNQTNIRVILTTSTTKLEEVTVQASQNTRTEIAVLEERKKSAIIQDAISAQQIERTGSITTTQALQRVSGVTITDDKYVAVRGLGDRSVIGQLNGVRLASSDPDRSAIPLDLVPASLLDNITIYKTVAADKPADAASGIVELKTKSVPNKKTFEFIAQTGFNNSVGIGGNYNSFWNSQMGAFGTRINNKNLSNEFVNLAKQYPDGLSSIQSVLSQGNYGSDAKLEANRINNLMQSFDPVLKSQTQRAPLNQLYSATFGNSYDVFGKHKLGLIIGGNYYRRINNIYNGNLTQYSIYQGVVTGHPHIYSPRKIPNFTTTNNIVMGKYQTYQEHTGVETLNYGGLTGLTYKFNSNHEISFQYLGSWGGENTATNLRGGYFYAGLPGDVNSTIYSLKQSYRTLNTFNIQGEHRLLNREYSPKLSYNLASSTSTQNDPDYRFVNMIDYKPRFGGVISIPVEGNSPNGSQIEYVYTERYYALNSGYVNGFGPYGIMQADPNGRRWRNLNETNYNYKADLSVPFPLLGLRQELKLGANYLNRERKFSERVLFLPGSNFTSSGNSKNMQSNLPLYAVNGDLNQLVSNEIIGVKVPTEAFGEGDFPKTGFLYNIQKSPNNYKGFYETKAFYAMLDLKLIEQLRIAGGIRFENTNIQSSVDTSNVYLDPSLLAANADGTVNLNPQNPNAIYKSDYHPFYSTNITYLLNNNMNFRLAFNTTLARPELRELTNVYEFDAFQMGLVVGNNQLINQYTKNIDFRWEWFPNPGEVLAISAFGKQIDDQLVKVYSLQTKGLSASFPEFPVIQFQNDPNTGQVYGLEFEVVKNLSFMGAPNLFLGTNLLIAESNIKKTQQRLDANWSIDRNAPTNSPLFEQAPYSINAWLNYTNKKLGTDFTSTFNMVGERLIQINLTGEPDLYTQPFAMLDFVLTQKINNRILFKGYAKNVLNPSIRTVYTNPGTGGKWFGNEYLNRSYKRGAEFMLGFTYNLF